LVGVAILFGSFRKRYDIPLSYLLQMDFWMLLTLLFATGTILSGFYPAIILSSFRPIAVLKGKVFRTSQGTVMRKSLVVFQFAASVVLISGSVIVYQQLNFMQKQDLGIDINHTLVIKAPGIADSTFAEKLKSFKAESLQISGVKAVSASTNVPGDEIFWASGIRQLARGRETSISGYTVGIDEDYVPAFGLKIVAGRAFDRNHTDEASKVLVNESMAHALGYEGVEKAVGEKVVHGGDTLEIAGVLANYHQMSLKEAVSPLVFRNTPSNAAFLAFKLEDGQLTSDILTAIEEPWKTFFPGNPVDHFFLDQFFNRQYESDRQFGQIFTVFTILAIFIACLGLFGLASFMTAQRTKEIGIRKVLGSSASNIVLLLSKGFIQLVLIANLIAWPLAWWLMSKWLESFPYRIDINPMLFILAGLGVVVIAFISVGVQTLKAALIDPSKTLKYE
jgi:putative ABC transport system permease protein